MIDGMKPETVGRTVGIGLRVAGRIAGQRMAAQAEAAAAAGHAVPGTVADPGVQVRAAGQTAGRATRGAARGVGGFLRPFTRVGGILWLEVTGVFFLLFAVVFAAAAWRVRPAGLHGPFDKAFLVSCGAMVVFFYLCLSSFWRARRR